MISSELVYNVAMSQDRPSGGDSLASDEPDISTWPTKQEAATALGKSIKTIERYAASRRKATRLRKAELHVAGRKPIPVFHPDDIHRLKKAINAEEVRMAVEAKDHSPSLVKAQKAPAVLPGQLALAGILEQISARLQAPEAPAVRLNDKMLLTVAEASEFGWPADDLKRLVRTGKLRNFGGPGKFRIARVDLERLLETHGMVCAFCGCSDEAPCQTAEGPCSWAAPGVCSACVEKLQPRVAAGSEVFR